MNLSKLKSKYDNNDMYSAICAYPNHISYSIDYMENWHPKNNYKRIRNILYIGMGGSAIGGDFMLSLADKFCNIPIVVNRSYKLPNWVSKETLVIVSSYSGETEETLSAFKIAMETGAKIICLGTGGKLLKLAEKHNLDIIEIKNGIQPRAAIGFFITINLILLEKVNIVSKNIIKKLLLKSLKLLTDKSTEYSKLDIESLPYKLAKKIHSKFPIIYASDGWQTICALRLRAQLAENSKMLSSHFSFPEQNHNEIEGWTNDEKLKDFVICWIRDISDHTRIKKRFNHSIKLLSKFSSNQITIEIEGNSKIERALHLVHLIDWISYYSALLNEKNPSSINQIAELKKMISNN